jgi:hypothetical protein
VPGNPTRRGRGLIDPVSLREAWRLRARTAALVVGDGTRALAGTLVPLVLVLGWIARTTPPPEIRRVVLGLDASERALALGITLFAVVLASAPAVHIALASQRIALLRALPLSAAWWQRTHALHLFVVDAPWWAALGYGIAPIAGADATSGLSLAIAGAGTLTAAQVVPLALADRPLLARWAVVAALVAIAATTWSLPDPRPAAVVGAIAFACALVRMRRPWPEPHTRSTRPMRLRSAALAWARLLFAAWCRRAPSHVAFVLAVQLAALAMVALAAARDVADGPWVALSRGVVVAGALLGASSVLVAVRVIDRDRWWFDATPLSTAAEHRGRLVVAIAGASPSLVVGTVVAIAHAAPTADAVAPLVATAWAVTVALDLVAGRERARALHQAAWRRWLLAAVLGELLALAVGVAALLPWIAVATVRGPRRLADVASVRRRFELHAEHDDHG